MKIETNYNLNDLVYIIHMDSIQKFKVQSIRYESGTGITYGLVDPKSFVNRSALDREPTHYRYHENQCFKCVADLTYHYEQKLDTK